MFKRGKGNDIEMARGGCKEEVAKPNYILKDRSLYVKKNKFSLKLSGILSIPQLNKIKMKLRLRE